MNRDRTPVRRRGWVRFAWAPVAWGVIVVALLMATVVFADDGRPPAAGSDRKYKIAGVITDGASGAPLAGVTVSSAGQTDTTDSHGRYVIDHLQPGAYTITPARAGYVFLPPARVVTVPPDATGQDFSGAAPGAYSVRGRVTQSENGAGLTGVRVTAGGRAATTAGDGSFAIGGLAPGTYVVTAEMTDYGFVPQSYEVTVPPDAAAVGFSATAKRYDAWGVITLDGAPLAGVAVSNGAGKVATTDAAGRYRLAGLAAGAQTLTPSLAGYSFSPPSRAVTLPPDAFGQDFSARADAAPDYGIAGTVTRDGAPLAYVTVTAGGRSALTDEAGRYAIDGLPAGAYTLVPSREGYTFSPPSRAVALPPSAAAQDFSAAAATYEVRGTVRDADGDPVEGVTVRSDMGHSATTDAAGQYRLGGLPSGSYELTASGLGRGYFPAVRRVTLPPNVIAQNFQALEPGAIGPSGVYLPLVR